MGLSAGLLQPVFRVDFAEVLASYARPLAVWPLNESSGSAIVDATGQRPNGSYQSGITVAGGTWLEGGPIASFPGDKAGNAFSTSLRDAWDWEMYTAIVFCKVSDLSIWTDGSQHNILSIYSAGTTQRCEFRKQTTNNQIACILDTGAASKSFTKSSLSTTAWMMLAATNDKANDAAKFFFNGVQEGATQTSLGTDDATLMDRCIIGAANTSGSTGFPGLIGFVGLWNAILTPTQIAAIYDRLKGQNAASVDSYSALVSGGNWGPAFDAAIADAAVNRSYKVRVEPGTYEASGIDLDDGVTLEGAGAVVIQHPDGSDTTHIVNGKTYTTTGTISASSTSLVVASAANLQVGDRISVRGAGGASPYQYAQLAADLNAGATSLTVDDADGWNTSGYVIVGSEIIAYGGRTGTTLSSLSRGQYGTSDASHLTGATVAQAMALFAHITTIAGTTITLDMAASFAVTSATVTRGVRNATLQNITFDGSKPETPVADKPHAVNLAQAHNVRILNCTFQHVAQAAVMSYRGSSQILIEDCTLDDCGYIDDQAGAAIWGFQGAQVTVRDCLITASYIGVALDDRSDSSSEYDRVISDCLVMDCVIDGCDVGLNVTGVEDSCIRDNIISDCDRGLLGYGGAGQGTEPVPTTNITIVGNIFSDIADTAIYLDEPSSLIFVTDDNVYSNCGTDIDDQGDNPVNVAAGGNFEFDGTTYRRADEGPFIRFEAV